jgi:hypothetical protein
MLLNCRHDLNPLSISQLCHHVYPSSLTIELDHAVGQGEQGIILAAADVAAGLKARAALPDDDAAGPDRLAAEDFDT